MAFVGEETRLQRLESCERRGACFEDIGAYELGVNISLKREKHPDNFQEILDEVHFSVVLVRDDVQNFSSLLICCFIRVVKVFGRLENKLVF